MYPHKPEAMYKFAQTNEVESISGLVPTEGQVFSLAMASMTTYLSYLMIKMMRQHSNIDVKRNDTQTKTTKKFFQDIGGCSEAKKAISQIVDYIENGD